MPDIAIETAWRAVAFYVRAIALSGAPLVDLECGVGPGSHPFVTVVLEPRPRDSVFVNFSGDDYGHLAFVDRISRQVASEDSCLPRVTLAVRNAVHDRNHGGKGAK